MTASEAIYYSWGRALPASLQQSLEARLIQPLRSLHSLAELPEQAGLIWGVSASESSQNLLQQLYQLRVQQGQRGPICFYLRQPASNWLKSHAWLSASSGNLLPGFELLNAAEAESQGGNPLPLNGLLSDNEWQQSARALCWQKLAGLRHDLQHALHSRQKLSAPLRERLASLPQDLGQLAPLHSPLLAEIQQQLQAPPVEPRRLKPLLEQLWQGLASDSLQPERVALSRGLYQLREHWRGSLQAQARFAEGLAAYRAAEPELSAQLTDWLAQHPTRQLESSAGLLAAAQALKQLLQQRPASQRHTPLSQWLHNTLDQHLYTAAALIRHWEPRWQASQQHQAALQLARLPHSVPGWGMQLPLSLSGDSSQLRKLLIIEDDPVWQSLLRQQVESTLARFLQAYPGQQAFPWQVVLAGDLAEAEAQLPGSILVLADLSMPAQPGEAARREQGLAFLQRHFGSYQRQPRQPVMVHSVPGWWLQDQQDLLAAGVAEADIVPKNQHGELLDQRLYDRLCQWRTRQISPEHLRHQLVIRSTEQGLPQLLLDGMLLQLSPQPERLLLALAENPRRGLSAAEVHALSSAGIDADESGFSAAERLADDTHSAFAQRLQQVLAGVDAQKRFEVSQELRRLRYLWHENSRPAHNSRQTLQALRKALASQRSLLEWLDATSQNGQEHPCLLSQLIASQLPALAALPLAEQLAAFFEAEAPAADGQSPDAEVKRQRGQASDQIYRLKASLSEQARQLGILLDPNSVIDSEESPQGPRYRLRQQVQVQRQPLSAVNRSLQVLVLEDDPIYAVQIGDALDRLRWLEGLQLETLVISDLRSLQGSALSPDWLLLDLHLPAVPGGPASADGGLRALQQIRQACARSGKRLQTLVISALAHDDDLRLQARQLDVPLQAFVPKGESLFGRPWPESLDLALRHSLHSWQQDARLAPLTASAPGNSGLPDSLPLTVEVRYWGQRRQSKGHPPDRELALWVEADGPGGRSAKAVTHSGARAAFLAALLRAHPQAVDADSLSLWLLQQTGQRPESGDLAKQQRQLTNLVNRLRKEDISPAWPLEVLRELSPELGQPNPARHILRQQQRDDQRHYWLALRSVSGQEQIT